MAMQNPRKNFELDLDWTLTDQTRITTYVYTLLKLQFDPLHLQRKMEYTLRQNLTNFGTESIFAKHSDTTLHFLGKVLSYSFISSNTPENDAHSSHDNPCRTLRIGLHDKLLNLTPLFTPTLFSGSFTSLFGYPCYILTQYGIYFQHSCLYEQF